MLRNKFYGKLIGTNLVYAPANLEINGTWYIPATRNQLLDAGYYEIIRNEHPNDGNQYSENWEIDGEFLNQIWTLIPDTRTSVEKREEAYETRLCVVFPENSNDLITIDNSVKLVYEYSCENTERAAEIVTYLKQQITEQKAAIREEFPDE